jgi:deoxyribose-phosphate aldolase
MTSSAESTLSAQQMASYIDHTVLKPETGFEPLEKLCREAVENSFKAVCVNSGLIYQAAQNLKGSMVEVCSVVGFPLGAMETRAKAFEAENAIQDGATEIDMVLNLGYFKSGALDLTEQDVTTVKRAIGKTCTLKVILETCLLSPEEIVSACRICQAAGADFVKTSTGFSSGGARVEDVSLMRRTVGSGMGVKASGGIKDWDTALAMIEAGADRIGTSSGVEILAGARS